MLLPDIKDEYHLPFELLNFLLEVSSQQKKLIC